MCFSFGIQYIRELLILLKYNKIHQFVLQDLKQEVTAVGHLLVLCAILYDSRVSST